MVTVKNEGKVLIVRSGDLSRAVQPRCPVVMNVSRDVTRMHLPSKLKLSLAAWNEFLHSLFPYEDQRAQLQRSLGVACMVDEAPTTALYLVGPKGSGKSSFADAIRATIGETRASTASKSQVDGVGNGNLTNSATWPEPNVLFVDKFGVDKATWLARARSSSCAPPTPTWQE